MPAHLPRKDLIGRTVEQYQVVSELGGGGMGVVYLAQSADGQKVAIKTLKAPFAVDRELVSRFLAEARVLARLHHPGLVEILSVGQLDDGTHYYVMEFLEGRTFEDLIAKGAPFRPADVLKWMIEVLDALATVHQAGVVHRDLKPGNLFLSRTGVGAVVKLIDFGVAKSTGRAKQGAPKSLDTAFVGTPDYMSPEQVSGRPVTAASDIYALGCVMFEMLTAKPPFSDRSAAKKMLMHVENTPPRVSSVVPSIPPAIDEVVEWMLRKAPEHRPPSARELKTRLESLTASLARGGGSTGEHVSVFEAVTDPAILALPEEPLPALPAAPPPVARSKRWVWGAVCLGLAAGAAVAGYWRCGHS